MTRGVMTHPALDNAGSKKICEMLNGTCTTDYTTEQNHRLQTDCEHDDDKAALELKYDDKVSSLANGEFAESAVLGMDGKNKDKILSWLLKHVNVPCKEPDKGLQPTNQPIR